METIAFALGKESVKFNDSFFQMHLTGASGFFKADVEENHVSGAFGKPDVLLFFCSKLLWSCHMVRHEH